jgi:tRNA(fMet)-specific endonuclease VapC
MGIKVLLDTSAYSELKRGHAEVAGHVRRSERILMSAVVVGELLYGFRAGGNFDKNRSDLDAFLDNPYVTFLPVTFVTADRFALIASNLKKKGTPIPTNDIWIAAHALEAGADLISFDRHFEAVEGLVWMMPSR